MGAVKKRAGAAEVTRLHWHASLLSSRLTATTARRMCAIVRPTAGMLRAAVTAAAADAGSMVAGIRRNATSTLSTTVGLRRRRARPECGSVLLRRLERGFPRRRLCSSRAIDADAEG